MATATSHVLDDERDSSSSGAMPLAPRSIHSWSSFLRDCGLDGVDSRRRNCDGKEGAGTVKHLTTETLDAVPRNVESLDWVDYHAASVVRDDVPCRQAPGHLPIECRWIRSTDRQDPMVRRPHKIRKCLKTLDSAGLFGQRSREMEVEYRSCHWVVGID